MNLRDARQKDVHAKQPTLTHTVVILDDEYLAPPKKDIAHLPGRARLVDATSLARVEVRALA